MFTEASDMRPPHETPASLAHKRKRRYPNPKMILSRQRVSRRAAAEGAGAAAATAPVPAALGGPMPQ